MRGTTSRSPTPTRPHRARGCSTPWRSSWFRELPPAASGDTLLTAGSGPFPAATADAQLSARFGIPPGYVQQGQLRNTIPSYHRVNAFGRGCHIEQLLRRQLHLQRPTVVLGRQRDQGRPERRQRGRHRGRRGQQQRRRAARSGRPSRRSRPTTRSTPASARSRRFCRARVRAADFDVYWGAGGVVDSVIDVTHNVPVPFADSMGGTWGILNQSTTSAAASGDGATGTLSLGDFGCVFPLSDPARHAGPGAGLPGCDLPALQHGRPRSDRDLRRPAPGGAPSAPAQPGIRDVPARATSSSSSCAGWRPARGTARSGRCGATSDT